jgi:hypothetical protein
MIRKAAALLVLALPGCIYEVRRPQPLPPGPPIGKDEVERLSAAGVSEPVLIELVEKRGARKLSADDIVALKKAGASDAVIQKMISLENREPERVYVEVPGYYRSYYGYYDPWYYWGPTWGFGWYGSWGYHHHHYSRGYSGLGVRIYR